MNLYNSFFSQSNQNTHTHIKPWFHASIKCFLHTYCVSIHISTHPTLLGAVRVKLLLPTAIIILDFCCNRPVLQCYHWAHWTTQLSLSLGNLWKFLSRIVTHLMLFMVPETVVIIQPYFKFMCQVLHGLNLWGTMQCEQLVLMARHQCTSACTACRSCTLQMMMLFGGWPTMAAHRGCIRQQPYFFTFLHLFVRKLQQSNCNSWRESQKSRPDQQLSTISLEMICCKYLRKNCNGRTRIDAGRTNETSIPMVFVSWNITYQKGTTLLTSRYQTRQ